MWCKKEYILYILYSSRIQIEQFSEYDRFSWHSERKGMSVTQFQLETHPHFYLRYFRGRVDRGSSEYTMYVSISGSELCTFYVGQGIIDSSGLPIRLLHKMDNLFSLLNPNKPLQVCQRAKDLLIKLNVPDSECAE